MTVVAVGDHGNAYILAMQIAASSNFQSVVTEVTQAAAMDHIHYPFVDFDESGAILADLAPPRAIVCDELGDEEFVTDGIGKWNLLESWWVSFDFNIPAAYLLNDTLNEWAWFTLQVKNIINDVLALGKTGNPVGSKTYMQISTFRRIEGPYRIDPVERGNLDNPASTQPSVIWHVAYEVGRGF